MYFGNTLWTCLNLVNKTKYRIVLCLLEWLTMWLFESSWWQRWNFSENTYKTWGFWANVWQQERSCHFLGFIVSVRPTLLSDRSTSPPEHDLCTQKWQRMTDHFLGVSKKMAVTSAHSFRCAAQWTTYRSRLSGSICLAASLHVVPTAAPVTPAHLRCADSRITQVSSERF